LRGLYQEERSSSAGKGHSETSKDGTTRAEMPRRGVNLPEEGLQHVTKCPQFGALKTFDRMG